MYQRELGNLLRVSRCFDSYRRGELRDVDVCPALQPIISRVCRFPGCTQDSLVEQLCLDKSTVARHLARLEELGYIERRAAENDARFRVVYPTQKAVELFPRLRETYFSFYEALLAGLTEEERAVLASLSAKLCENAKATL